MTQQTQNIPIPVPHKSQAQVLREAKRFNVLDCGRRWGKSMLSARLMIKTATNRFPVGYFAPTYKLLEGTFAEVYRRVEPMVVKKHENQFIQLFGGGSIEFWSLERPNAGRSRKYKLAVIDEAAFVKDLWTEWTESIRPTLTDLEGSAWFMSTPKGKNDFYKLFVRGGSEPNWASWKMSTYTNPFINAAEIDEAKADLPELAFSQEYLAEFSENVANPFGVQFIRQCIYPISTLPPVCYGIDLAKSSDYTVIIGLDQHGQVCHFDRFQKDWRGTIQTITGLPQAPIKVDSTGVGDPVAEELQIKRPNVSGFKFSANSKQQLMEGLAMGIQQRKVFFPDGLIVQELENFEYEFTRTGVKYSAPAGLHDDCVCALALAYDCYKNNVSFGQYSWA